jgi:D-sedoheptulose 7-phosphate isomerase
MVNTNGEEFVAAELHESMTALLPTQQSVPFRTQTLEIARAIVGSLKRGGKVLLADNGGSAADAQHIAGELVSRMNYDRPAYAGLALSTDTSVLTANRQ